MNLELIEQETARALRMGCRSFQVHRFGNTQVEHNERLVRWAEFPRHARVMDLGSGVGEFARTARRIDPSLDFYLVNLSLMQLRESPEFECYYGSFLDVPQPDASVDAITFLFSIGHELHTSAMEEAARLLRSCGILFIYDMVRTHGTNESMASVDYTVHPRSHMESLADLHGFRLDFYLEPYDDGLYGRFLLGQHFDEVFDGTKAAIWRFIKR